MAGGVIIFHFATATIIRCSQSWDFLLSVIETSAQLGGCHRAKKKLQKWISRRRWWETVINGPINRLPIKDVDEAPFKVYFVDFFFCFLLSVFSTPASTSTLTVCKLGIIASKYSSFALWQLHEWIFRYLWMWNNRQRQWSRRMNFTDETFFCQALLKINCRMFYSCIEHQLHLS